MDMDHAMGRAEDFMAGRRPMRDNYRTTSEWQRMRDEGQRLLLEAKRRADLDAALCRAISRMR